MRVRLLTVFQTGINLILDEINQWKQKYEALAKLYAQLRKEHLDLLQKFKTLKDSGGKVADEARKKLEQAEALLKVCVLFFEKR